MTALAAAFVFGLLLARWWYHPRNWTWIDAGYVRNYERYRWDL